MTAALKSVLSLETVNGYTYSIETQVQGNDVHATQGNSEDSVALIEVASVIQISLQSTVSLQDQRTPMTVGISVTVYYWSKCTI